MQTPAQPRTLWATWFAQAQSTPLLSLSFLMVLLVVLGLLIASGYNAIYGTNQQNLHYALLGGTAGFGATALGAVMAERCATSNSAARTSCLASQRA